MKGRIIRSTQIIFALVTLTLTHSVMAQDQASGPPVRDVNVVNTPNVSVVNPSLDVAVNSLREGRPYSEDVVGTCNDVFCLFDDFTAVPDGELLVILHISVLVRPQATTTVVDFAELVTSDTEQPVGARNYFPMTRIGHAGVGNIYDSWATNAPVRAYVLPGQSPRITVASSVGGAFPFSTATLSGYVIDNNP